MHAQRLPYKPTQQASLHVNRAICPRCGSDDINEVLLCTPHQAGWRECMDCNWAQPHGDACVDCPTEPITYCPRSGIRVAIASMVAFAVLLGLSWLYSTPL